MTTCSALAAEELILGAFGMPGFSVCLLKLVTHQSVSADVRLQASIQFKNLVAKRWVAVSLLLRPACSALVPCARMCAVTLLSAYWRGAA